jgi:hypothetical protein
MQRFWEFLQFCYLDRKRVLVYLLDELASAGPRRFVAVQLSAEFSLKQLNQGLD